MNDETTFFEDLMASLNEVEAYQKGELSLRTRTVTTDDTDPSSDQLIWRKITILPEPKKQQLNSYLDELLQA